VADIPPLRLTTPSAEDRPTPAGSVGQPIVVDARRLAEMLCVGIRTVRSWDASGRIPAPVRLSPGCVRWKLSEIHDWIAAGAPCRQVWEARRAARS
jgi:predicted DNA-binding transcriptional regulator AlpA